MRHSVDSPPGSTAASPPGQAGSGAMRSRWLSLSATWIVLILMPFWLPLVGGWTELGSWIVIYGLAAISLNFLLGFTGQLSFGHAAFFGVGGYITGLALIHLTHSTVLALILGTLAGGLVAVVMGPFVIRLRGIYFAMITVAFAQLLYFIATAWNSVTGGEDGLTGFSRQPLHLGFATIPLDSTAFYYLSLISFAVAIAIMSYLLHGPFGRTMIAIRENERRARFLGIHVERYIWASFAVSGLFTGLAGALFALLQNFTSPENLFWIFSGDLVIMAVLGGMRTFWGPLIGAAVYVLLSNYLSSITTNWMTLLGILFMVVVLAFPKGILGLLTEWFERRRGAA